MDQLLSLITRFAFRLPGEFLSRHAIQLRKMFRAFRGNARVLVLTNICWMIPVTFSTVYLPIFMAEQGLSKTQIGTIGTVSFIFQVLGALLGGRVAEKLGWKRTLITFDGVLWPTVFLCFILAHGYFPFVVSAMLMGGMNIVMPAWISLFIAGVPKSQRAFIFIFNQIPPLLCGMLAPIYGYFISMMPDQAGQVSAVARWVYALGIILVFLGWWMRFKWLKDPYTGGKHVVSRSIGGWAGLVRGHLKSASSILGRRGMLIFVFVQVLTWAALSTSNTYMNLYLVDGPWKDLGKGMLSILPVFTGIATILTTLLVVPFITSGGLFGFMLTGVALMGMYPGLVLSAPPKSLSVIVAGAMAWAAGWSMFWPSLMAHWSNMMTDRERPHLIALSSAVIMLSISPVPTIAGAMFDLHPRNPLLLLIGMLVTVLGLVAWAAYSGGSRRVSLTARRRVG